MLPAVTRIEPPVHGDERPMLTAWLDWQRSTLLRKCELLDGQALARRSVPTSNLSLLGIVRHMAAVEWSWFVRVFTASAAPGPISLEQDRDADFNDLDPARAMDDIAMFERQCEVSRRIAAAARSLDDMAAWTKREVSLRWIMVHMIEEYARHNGHADLLREAIDGAVGE